MCHQLQTGGSGALRSYFKSARDQNKGLGEFFDDVFDIYKRSSGGPRTKVRLKKPKLLGETGANGVSIKLELVNQLGDTVGAIIRGRVSRQLEYKLILKGKNHKINLYSTVDLADFKYGIDYNFPIREGEELLYVDFTIPKEITDSISGLGKIMLDDSLALFRKNKNLKSPDGTLDLYIKSEKLYRDYGGESLLLTQFNDARNAGESIEDAAFSTFGGEWAKDNGFTNIIIDSPDDISETSVLIKYLKEK